MAQNLFIRVSAETYDDNAVPRAWPLLFAASWPDPYVDSKDSPAALAKQLSAGPGRGVLQLVDAFSDFAHYGDITEAERKVLEPAADKATDLKRELEDALGDRDVHRAFALCGSIEKALDEAEKILGGLKRQ